ncbi:putative thiazole-containing bacteriocin maturation protein [Aneurinibacillus aneurinilyticus]|uniref:Putative thiazole-containing bacteriocin maturation protein n=1 Tax=Aneurinibacillus aneurinilyticus ATCC 12856 TaxID=649747 RepID=U1X6X9_ANEAE|nr:putative thiazole-containing bacteriocin maturation protein [Aneurinibacillus aneurinilyticus]ERI10730.1 putative thiazole-containing bacteriocin maturation protein [Aneurinibacillus aneurinilyticus ATCC 12856]MED0709255.1 putative thiazole-containing bacteriocin maturation protein [Aneurinibacillus aneurinilyticus]MED0724885.1 putative thiazole-containing bacteriocin maturation protein [Aneurinibacillus aneurinilyticus]MED0732500.1 putative thiazole-containing bacteriocin maturation protein
MANLPPYTRLKVKRDTFFLPDPDGGVYFRNNVSSFRMEGSTIDQWIEKLIPMFNGEHTLKDLTDGLPSPYRDRVYEIAGVLYENSFVRDVSQDRPHQLSDEVLKRYASQIEFLDSFGDSGAYRFQIYRQAKVLAVGSGPFFVSLVSALLESGLPRFHVLITDAVPTNRLRLMELVEHACKTDPEVGVEEIFLQEEGVSSWREAVQPFHSVLYVSQESDVEELRVLHRICREEEKVLLPAICLQQVGLAGPLVHPDSEGCWESAWRRIHQSALGKGQQLGPFSSTAGAMLANVIVFELFKKITGVSESEQTNQFFLLNLETLEGNWHSFMPHPFVTGRVTAEWIQDFDVCLEQSSSKSEPSRLLPCFSQLTSPQSGILHIWEEGDLNQLPLAQCRVQAVDPLSEGPAELLPDIVCVDLTHEEARREAGLVGVEAYVSRMIGPLVTTFSPHQEVEDRIVELQEFVGIGVGETIAEGVCRGLQKCLAEELGKQQVDQNPPVFQVQLDTVEDERSRFYLQALSTMHGAPIIGLGEEVFGFPVVWIGVNGHWYGSAGLNMTLAFQKALQQAFMKVQNEAACLTPQALEVLSMPLGEKMPLSLKISSCEEVTQLEILQSALQILKRNRKQLLVFDLAVEPFLKEKLAGVFGVLLREEES